MGNVCIGGGVMREGWEVGDRQDIGSSISSSSSSSSGSCGSSRSSSSSGSRQGRSRSTEDRGVRVATRRIGMN